MRLQLVLVMFGCWSVGCFVAQARIGDTVKQCEERYGKATPVSTDKSSLIYSKPPLLVMVHFYQGRCDRIAYVKAEKDSADIRKELTEDDRDVLQKANGAGRQWKKSPQSGDDTVRFETTDRELGSEYGPMDHVFIIWTRGAYKRYEDEFKAEEEKLRGF